MTYEICLWDPISSLFYTTLSVAWVNYFFTHAVPISSVR